jgi:hypothetical protein
MLSQPGIDPLTRDFAAAEAAAEARPVFFAGLDLGTRADPSAFSVVEAGPPAEATPGGKRRRRYVVRFLRRWPLKVDYADVVSEVVEMFAEPPLAGSPLLIDGTGVGVAVVQLFRAARPEAKLIPVTITGGIVARAARDGASGWNVPKRDLASVLQALLGTGRLKVAPGLELGKELAKEMQTFTVKVNINTGAESFEAWREKDKDDIVLATAMPCWYGERPMRQLQIW